jgi:hypothetical protein
VVHTRYDMLSFIRTLEIPIGMKPLGLADSLAVPLYDAFDGTAQNGDPYTAIPPNIPIDERNTASSPGAAASKRMNFRSIDSMPQRDLDAVLWKYPRRGRRAAAARPERGRRGSPRRRRLTHSPAAKHREGEPRGSTGRQVRHRHGLGARNRPRRR